MTNRFFLPRITINKDEVVIKDKKVISQITKVLHLKKNDLFIIFSSPAEYRVILKEIEKDYITATILEKQTPLREPDKQLFLYQALLKKDKFEWIIQKGVELGVRVFVPIITHHTIVRRISINKLTRYQKIITEATEQSGGQQLARLEKTMTFEQAIKNASKQEGQKILAWEGQIGNELSKAIDKDSNTYHLFIGPEGGFSPQEIELAKTNNITIFSLGKRILRPETAAMAACSLILLSD